MDNEVLIKRIEEISQEIINANLNMHISIREINKFNKNCEDIIKSKSGNDMIFKLGEQFIYLKTQVEILESMAGFLNRIKGSQEHLIKDIKKVNQI